MPMWMLSRVFSFLFSISAHGATHVVCHIRLPAVLDDTVGQDQQNMVLLIVLGHIG